MEKTGKKGRGIRIPRSVDITLSLTMNSNTLESLSQSIAEMEIQVGDLKKRNKIYAERTGKKPKTDYGPLNANVEQIPALLPQKCSSPKPLQFPKVSGNTTRSKSVPRQFQMRQLLNTFGILNAPAFQRCTYIFCGFSQSIDNSPYVFFNSSNPRGTDVCVLTSKLLLTS